MIIHITCTACNGEHRLTSADLTIIAIGDHRQVRHTCPTTRRTTFLRDVTEQAYELLIYTAGVATHTITPPVRGADGAYTATPLADEAPNLITQFHTLTTADLEELTS